MQMIKQMMDLKNDLEASIYATRAALMERLEAAATAEEHTGLMAKLADLEDWIYEEREEESAEEYRAQIAYLQAAVMKSVSN